MGKTHPRSGFQKSGVVFYLDECLSYRIAYVLEEIGYPITSWHKEFNAQQGIKDTPLIQYLGAKHYTWITKDDAAKKEHETEIRTAAISVVWVHGLERPSNKPKQNHITVLDLHRMLTDRLGELEEEIAGSNKPQYWTLAMKSDGSPRLTKTTLETFFKPPSPT